MLRVVENIAVTRQRSRLLEFTPFCRECCRSGEEQSHKSPTPGGGPDEYRRAVKSILIYLENTSGI